jgi:hypothetical protein
MAVEEWYSTKRSSTFRGKTKMGRKHRKQEWTNASGEYTHTHTHTHNIYIKKTKRSCGSRVKESNRDQLIRTAKRAVPPQKEKDGLARGQP